jgi:hypothetical protein
MVGDATLKHQPWREYESQRLSTTPMEIKNNNKKRAGETPTLLILYLFIY